MKRKEEERRQLKAQIESCEMNLLKLHYKSQRRSAAMENYQLHAKKCR
jgi:hypothetical protein